MRIDGATTDSNIYRDQNSTHYFGDGCPEHVCPNEPHDRSERGEKYCSLRGKHYPTEQGQKVNRGD